MTGMSNHYIVKPYVKSIESAEAEGILYGLPYGYPAMTDGNRRVKGQIFELDPDKLEQAIKLMDKLEGYCGPDNFHNLYQRSVQTVKNAKGEGVSAYLYLWYKPEELVRLGTLVASGDWRKFKK